MTLLTRLYKLLKLNVCLKLNVGLLILWVCVIDCMVQMKWILPFPNMHETSSQLQLACWTHPVLPILQGDPRSANAYARTSRFSLAQILKNLGYVNWAIPVYNIKSLKWLRLILIQYSIQYSNSFESQIKNLSSVCWKYFVSLTNGKFYFYSVQKKLFDSAWQMH